MMTAAPDDAIEGRTSSSSLEVKDARAVHRGARGHGRSRSSPSRYEPPWGGCRFFCVDPDGYLVEIEQPA